ncbi:MAG: hypothetical protein ACR2NP_21770 [Pirellulaceae bacterium]
MDRWSPPVAACPYIPHALHSLTAVCQMARRYILGCHSCDHPIIVEITQAGQSINCPECQSSVTVGTLREIKALPEHEESTAESGKSASSSGGMSATNRLIFVIGTLMLVLGSIWGGYTMLKSSRLMQTKPPVEITERMKNQIDDWSPSRILDAWENVSIDAADQWREHPFLRVQRIAHENRLYSWIGFSIAGVGLLTIVSAFVFKL